LRGFSIKLAASIWPTQCETRRFGDTNAEGQRNEWL